MNICVTGGAGYVGSVLVPELLNLGHSVTVLDTFWFKDFLSPHQNLRKVCGDIRNVLDLDSAFKGQDVVIHLACVSNDPSFDMNPNLGKSINYTCFRDILAQTKRHKIKRFIYASSSSVYGVSELDSVTEDAPKKPLTDYSKYKLACEIELKNFGCGCPWTIIRPATVCGYGPRQRLDLIVNILTTQAACKRQMTIHGGTQLRPNIDIRDMVQAYVQVLHAAPKDVDQKIFNVGFENYSLNKLSAIVQDVLGEDIEVSVTETNDKRSYHINSDKISRDLNFVPKYSIADAVKSLSVALKKSWLKEPLTNPVYYNIKRMKELGL